MEAILVMSAILGGRMKPVQGLLALLLKTQYRDPDLNMGEAEPLGNC